MVPSCLPSIKFQLPSGLRRSHGVVLIESFFYLYLVRTYFFLGGGISCAVLSFRDKGNALGSPRWYSNSSSVRVLRILVGTNYSSVPGM